MKQITIDVGGTFTDCLVLDESRQIHRFKAPTTPADPTEGFFAALGQAAARFGETVGAMLASVEQMVHGTTIGTNALITGRGAEVGMITTKGFRDSIEMRRGIKNLHGAMFDVFIAPYQPLVPRYRRLGVRERTLFDGTVSAPLNEAELEAATRRLLDEGCTSIAVCFLHSYANGSNELRAKQLIRAMAPNVYVTASHEILPVWREFERFSTTVVSAYIGPVLSSYVVKLKRRLAEAGFRGRLLLMLANGLVQTVDECVDRAVYLLNSGPAAAPSAATYFGGESQRRNLLSVDMGGTSFDVCVIKDGEIPMTTDSWVGEHRVAIKMVDVPTVGAGGGSIAWVDTLGLLHVGPQSAGADPGPAAYGKGVEATVTDANLVLGYIPDDYFLGGDVKLDIGRARDAVARVGARLDMGAEAAAQAVYTTVNTVMSNLITEVCTKQGHDVRDFTLVAGGGAGGIHAAAIAQQLSIPVVIVPRVAALMSAFGMFSKDIGLEYARSLFRNRKHLTLDEVSAVYEAMTAKAGEDFRRIGIDDSTLTLRRSVEMRYVGQFHEVEVEWPGGPVTAQSIEQVVASFHAKYEKMYTYSMDWRPIEFLTFRLRVTAARRPITMTEAASGTTSAESARRGARACLLAGRSGRVEVPVFDGDRLRPGLRIEGPALIDDKTTTVLVPANCTCDVDQYRNLILRMGPASTAGAAGDGSVRAGAQVAS
jgi:N-methylhydantoinase A